MSEKKDLTIEAQNYSLKHKLKNFTGKGVQRAISEMGSSKYSERMDTLREADDEMRTTAVLFKDYLKNAEKAFKDNRYLDVAHWCSMINDGVKLMMKDAKAVVDLRDAEIAEYYTRHEDANPEHNYFSADDGLVSTAGLLNRLFGNSIEKLYWKKVRESKLAIQALISKTEKLVAITYSSLDRMGSARAQGNIGVWIEDLQRIGKAQNEFQVFAKGIYDKHLKELADIVRANKPQPVQNQPVNTSIQTAPATTLTSENPDEAKELVEDKIDNSTAPVVEEQKTEESKFGPGRPALNDPRVVQDKDKNKKELDQWEQVSNLLKGNQPEIKSPEPITTERIKNEPEVAPEVKLDSGKTEQLKSENPIKVELAKVEIQKPIITNTPTAPQTPKAPIVENIVKRPRGRPRIYPLPTANVENTNPIVDSVPSVQIPAQEIAATPFSSPAVDIPKSLPVAPKEIAPVTQVAPKVQAPKEEPVHVDIKGKDPEITPSTQSTDTKPLIGQGKKITFVMIPKIKPDNLNALKEKLETNLGNPILYITKSDGAIKAKEYKDAGWDVDAMIYDDAVKLIENKTHKEKRDPLTLLDDPNFLAGLPQLSNGFYDKSRIIDDNGQRLSGNKVVVEDSKYPEFNNMDKATRKAVIDKLNKIDEENAANPNFVKNKDKVKNIDESKIPSSEVFQKELEKIPGAIKTPEIKLPEVENIVKRPRGRPRIHPLPTANVENAPVVNSKPNIQMPDKEIIVPEVKAPEIKIPEVSKAVEVPEVKEQSPEEIADLISNHTAFIEGILNKKVSEMTDSDVFQLFNSREYLESLPKKADGTYKLDLISQFPEVKILKNADFDSSKLFFNSLRDFEKGKIPLPKAKTKAANNVNNILIKVAHNNFFTELTRVAKTENYGLMAALMCKYSEQIEEIDPVLSIQLLQQAEKLLD